LLKCNDIELLLGPN